MTTAQSIGFTWSLHPEDSITKHIQSGRVWESHMVKFMELFIKPHYNAVDCGACFGYHTLTMAKAARDGMVVAFEPFETAHKLLQENIRQNGFTNIICVKSALAEKEKTAHLCNAYEENINIGDSFVSEAPPSKIGKAGKLLDVNRYKIDCMTLDVFLENKIQIDFIKIDVQGYELNVLQGGAKFFEEYKPVIAIEVEESCLLMNGYSAKTLFDHIRTMGYEIYYLESDYPCDHICVHRTKLDNFVKEFSQFIRPHTENNNVSNNYENGIRQKISLL